jgi:thiol:disulfide interchange protein
MLRHLFLIASLLILSCESRSQILKPATLVADPVPEKVRVGDVIELVFKAQIQKGWYIYSVGFEDCGPIPMTVKLEPDKGFELVGDLVAIHDKTKHDEIFDCDVRIFEGTGEFRQKIKILAPEVQLKGSYEGQVCSTQCVLFDGDLFFSAIKAEGKAVVPKEEVKQNIDKTKTTQVAALPAPKESSDSSVASPQNDKKAYGKIEGPILDPSLIGSDPAKGSYWLFFLLAFVAGLAALLTPCVFPMIPMTVSYFTAPGRTRAHALIYGLSIVAIYTLVGAALSPFMGPETANHLSTEWLPNIIFFLVFIVFGLSFLGLFDITLPGSLVNEVDRKADKGGLAGIFFMALTLVLVSFSCTGPLVGSILVSSAGGEFVKPIIGMFGFSLAFAIPFTLFAFFPEWLRSLPKSGGWLNKVKVVLGFLEIALAFKFLSIADQAFHWGILDREISIAIWIVISILIGAYLMKWFLLPGDTGKDAENKRVNILSLVVAMFMFTFTIYLIPGMWGAPLKSLAGYLPPLYTHDFDVLSVHRNGDKGTICEEPRHRDFLHLPHGLSGYFDYQQAMACARQQNKPLFIDFTGHGCTNCREMEAVVWPDPQVLKRLKEDYVVVALYIDDKTELPESDWYTSTYDSKVKKTIGKQNADLQIRRLDNNAQPFYVLVGLDEKVLVTPYGYDRDVEDFVKFLDEGKAKFKTRFPDAGK